MKIKLVLKNESFIVCIWSPTYLYIFLSEPPKLWSAQLRSSKSLPPRLLHPPKKSLPRCCPLRSPSSPLLLPRCLLKRIRVPSCWRITSHIWDQSLVLTTGSSTPPEESLVWSSTDELACRSSLSMSIHPLFCSSINLRSFQLHTPHGQPGQNMLPFFTSDSRSGAFLHFCSHTFFPNSCFILLKMQLQ